MNPCTVFIIGASGSGTTMLSRILSRPAGCASLGGNHVDLPDDSPRLRELVDLFNGLTQTLWDRHAGMHDVREARSTIATVLDELLNDPAMRHLTHVVYKRSAPFMEGDRYRPDLADVFDLFNNVVVIAAYRDPRASAASSLRRGFAPTLRQCAVITEEQLTYLNAQLATLDPDRWLILPYEPFCVDPESWVEPLASLTSIDPNALRDSIDRERIDASRNHRWRLELAADDVEMLDGFFDDRRRSQWPLLHDTSMRRSTAQPAGA